MLHQVVDEEMDSHGSDDSDTFTTPPGSVTAGTESDRLQPECPEGEVAMEEDQSSEEWKTIMPEVSGFMGFVFTVLNVVVFLFIYFFDRDLKDHYHGDFKNAHNYTCMSQRTFS